MNRALVFDVTAGNFQPEVVQRSMQQPVLLDFDASRAIAVSAWSDRVQYVSATYDGTWELPVLGAIPSPNAVLVRPDGYVAWVGEGTLEALTKALTTCFGPADR